MSLNYFCLLLSVALLMFKGCYTEVFTSSAEVENLFRLEADIVEVLQNFLSQTESKLVVIRRYLKDYKSVVEEKAEREEDFIERVAGNPLHAYQLMKRLSVDLPAIENEIKNVDEDKRRAVDGLETLKRGVKFPQKEDFFGAVQALVRLQDTFELNMTQLTKGNLRGRQTTGSLSAQDCLYMGQVASNLGFYARSVEWLEQSCIIAGIENNQTVHQDEVKGLIQHTINVHDEVLRNNVFPIPAELVVFPQPLKDKPAVIQREEIIRKNKFTLEGHDLENEMLGIINFNELCRVKSLLLKSQQVVAQLKCWYDDRNQSYFRLMRIRVEQHSLHPVIYTFHNVLSDEEINVIKELSKPRLTSSSVFERKAPGGNLHRSGGQDPSIVIRNSKSAGFPNAHPLMSRLTKRIHLISGLVNDPSKDEAEIFSVSNYGIGGHFYPHHDNVLNRYFMKDSKEKEHQRQFEMGDRTATFMFFLSATEQGGDTAFPWAGVAVPPYKGGAAFWYNLKRNGEPDLMNLHGSCPLLYGHKWIATKWIRQTAQTFNCPCALDPNE